MSCSARILAFLQAIALQCIAVVVVAVFVGFGAVQSICAGTVCIRTVGAGAEAMSPNGRSGCLQRWVECKFERLNWYGRSYDDKMIGMKKKYPNAM